MSVMRNPFRIPRIPFRGFDGFWGIRYGIRRGAIPTEPEPPPPGLRAKPPGEPEAALELPEEHLVAASPPELPEEHLVAACPPELPEEHLVAAPPPELPEEHLVAAPPPQAAVELAALPPDATAKSAAKKARAQANTTKKKKSNKATKGQGRRT